MLETVNIQSDEPVKMSDPISKISDMKSKIFIITELEKRNSDLAKEAFKEFTEGFLQEDYKYINPRIGKVTHNTWEVIATEKDLSRDESITLEDINKWVEQEDSKVSGELERIVNAPVGV